MCVPASAFLCACSLCLCVGVALSRSRNLSDAQSRFLQVFGGHDGRKDLGDTHVIMTRPTRDGASSPTTSRPAAHEPVVVRSLNCNAAGRSVSRRGVGPAPRRFHTIVSDDTSGSLVLFGGSHGKYKSMADVWVLHRARAEAGDAPRTIPPSQEFTWYQPRVTGVAPQSRWGHSAALCGQSMVVFGGRDQGRDLNDVHILHLPACESRGVLPWWLLVNVSRPCVLFSPVSTMPTARKLYCTMECVWSTPQMSGVSPVPRRRHSACAMGRWGMRGFVPGQGGVVRRT